MKEERNSKNITVSGARNWLLDRVRLVLPGLFLINETNIGGERIFPPPYFDLGKSSSCSLLFLPLGGYQIMPPSILISTIFSLLNSPQQRRTDSLSLSS